MRYFELVSDKSSKFWEITDFNKETRKYIQVRYGKIGSEGQTRKTYYHGPVENGKKLVEKLVASKLKKGYVEKRKGKTTKKSKKKEKTSVNNSSSKKNGLLVGFYSNI
jgi:predicted DNA-binding WGR domain protein